MTLLPHDTPAVIGLTSQWVVAYKPAGWLTIPATPTGQASHPAITAPRTPGPSDGLKSLGVLSEWVRERYERAWVVHRLDRETSGVVLFARSEESHRLANQWFQEHRMKKSYDCLAVGVPKAPVLRLNRPIAGSPSVTQVEVKESYQEGFLARVTPITGRRHQIRIHLSGEGHPLWGDVEYRGPSFVTLAGKAVGQRLAIQRVALHSARLELPTHEIFEAYWPPDFKSWVERLRGGGTRV